MRLKFWPIAPLLVFLFLHSSAQTNTTKQTFTHADTLRGSVTKYRSGWDVLRYDLQVEPDIASRSVKGISSITYRVVTPFDTMQIDLQQPLVVDSVIDESGARLLFNRNGNLFFVPMKTAMTAAQQHIVKVFYHGSPKQARNAPWDGGLVWKEDNNKNLYVATACQGLGASVWWPCKDYQGDEPDNGMTIKLVAPDTLSAVSNGRLLNVAPFKNGSKLWTWEVKNPINNYDVTMNIGKYTHWNDTLNSEGGVLDMQFWVLEYNLAKAKDQFTQAKQMLRAFEHWFGKYPFIEDSYKLVDAPFLGMEHQSAVAYGNKYENGYLGKDLSGTGWGLKWDFIIVHESGHEWFGNNITAKDVADMWLHEGFTNYSETLFTEYYFGKEAGNEYCYGTRTKIGNKSPIIGVYGVNSEGSGDMYYKGGNLLHLIRHSIDNDEKFRDILRGLNKTFYHQTVTTQQVESYISKQAGINFSPVFDQYLRTTQIPVLEYYIDKKKLYYRWSNCLPSFNLSIVLHSGKKNKRINISPQWQSAKLKGDLKKVWSPATVDKNYYVKVMEVKVGE